MTQFLPPVFHSGISILLYVFMTCIVGLSLWQFVRERLLQRTDEPGYFRSLVPLGWSSVAFGFVGLFIQYQLSFDAIEAAGDISPAIVAGALRTALGYPVLGFFSLGVCYFFRFINQPKA